MISLSRIRSFTVVAATCVLACMTRESRAAVDPEVQKHFEVGNSLYKDGRYEEALREYNVAYEQSKNWKILYNRAQCFVMLVSEPEAIADFEQYLKEGGAEVPKDRRAEIESDLPKLRLRVGQIVIEGPSGGIVKVDRRVRGYSPLVVATGTGWHTIDVEPPPGFKGAPFHSEVHVDGQGRTTVTVEFKSTEAPAPVAPPPSPPLVDAAPPPPVVLPARPPGGLPAPSIQLGVQLGFAMPLESYGDKLQRKALGAIEVSGSLRATSFFEVGVFAGLAGGKQESQVSGVSNDGYTTSILGVRGRMHLVRTKQVDGWFGVDLGAWRETWKFSTYESQASSFALGLAIGLDVPLSRSWAVGGSARFLSASASNQRADGCTTGTGTCGGVLGDGTTARGFVDLGLHVLWVLPFGDEPKAPPAQSTTARGTSALSPAAIL